MVSHLSTNFDRPLITFVLPFVISIFIMALFWLMFTVLLNLWLLVVWTETLAADSEDLSICRIKLQLPYPEFLLKNTVRAVRGTSMERTRIILPTDAEVAILGSDTSVRSSQSILTVPCRKY